jgi:REP element-mobilizing transposase RayT
MPRKPRIEYPGACYHVMCRGNRREEIFWDDVDRELFLNTLGQACNQTGWIVHSYVLMSNHYHLLLETPESNLSDGMRWFQGTYAQRFCKRHGVVGHVYQGRYKAPLIDPEEPEHFRTVSDYIHLNPARAGMLGSGRPVLARYSWSSYPVFLGAKRKRPVWLEFARVAESLGLRGADSASRHKYRAYMERRTWECLNRESAEAEEEWNRIRRGWYVGGDGFRDRLLDLLDETLNGKKQGSFGGRMLAEHNEKRAKELVNVARRTLEMTAKDLQNLRKTDTRKQGVAWLIKTRTVMTNDWIDRELNMGSRTNIYKAVQAMENARTSEAKKLKKMLVDI